MEDKASALLSILQVKDTASEGQYRQGQDQLSHTQLEMAASGALHQHNPHHHSSQHHYHAHHHSEQPPPALHLHQHHHGPTFTVAQQPNQHGSQQPYQQNRGLSSDSTTACRRSSCAAGPPSASASASATCHVQQEHVPGEFFPRNPAPSPSTSGQGWTWTSGFKPWPSSCPLEWTVHGLAQRVQARCWHLTSC